MGKTIKKFRIGKKKQHESIARIERWDLNDKFQAEDYDRSCADDPKTIDEEVLAIIKHCHDLMDIKAEEMGLKGDEDIRLTTAHEYSPVFYSGLLAHQHLDLALYQFNKEQYESAFKMLLKAIPCIINTQALYNEATVVAGSMRQEAGAREVAERKEKRKKIAEPIFNGFREAGHSKTNAARLTREKLKDHPVFEYDLPAIRTIREWFK